MIYGEFLWFMLWGISVAAVKRKKTRGRSSKETTWLLLLEEMEDADQFLWGYYCRGTQEMMQKFVGTLEENNSYDF